MKTGVRFLAILFVLVMAMATVGFAAQYSDVDATNEHYEAIDFLSTLGILTGYDDGKFMPDELVEREEMAKIIYVTATTFFDGVEQKPSFSDVTADNWAAGYISWCVATDIVGGFEDNTFRPEANITYNQALKMAACMLGYTDFRSELWPQDVWTVALKTLDLGNGIPETVTGDTQITRAQAAQIIYNAMFEEMNIDVEIEEGEIYNEDEIQAETLVDDVWKLGVTTYQIVATENYGSVSYKNPSPYYNPETGEVSSYDPTLIQKYYEARATGSDKKIVIWDGVEGSVDTSTTPDFLSKWGLEEYEGRTDDILGFTIKEVSRDGKVVFTSGLTGERINGMSIDNVKTTAADFPKYAHTESNVYWRNDKMMVNGVMHEGEDFENLRVVVLLSDGVGGYQFNIFPQITYDYARNDLNYETDGGKKEGVWHDDPSVIIGPVYSDTNSETPAHYAGLNSNDFDLNMPYIFNGYPRYVRGVDKDADGIIDYVFLKWLYPYEVTSVTASGSNITLEITDLFDDAAPKKYINAKDVEFSSGDLKLGDVFMGTIYGDNQLYVDATYEPITSYATKVTDKTITFNEGGTVADTTYFVGKKKTATQFFGDLTQKLDFLGKTADGNNKLFRFWLRGKSVIKAERLTAIENTGFDKAILMYVAEPTDPQLNKLNNKLETYYPAYLIINGKEEAVNLNPSKALKTSNDPMYIHADSLWTDEDFALIVDTANNDVIKNQYKLVTYEVDANGYYTIVDSAINVDTTKTEKIFRANKPSDYLGTHDFKPKLIYNENTGLFTLEYYEYDIMLPGTSEDKIVTKTISVDVDEETFLYYKDITPSGFVDLKFYTAENLKDCGGFDSVKFESDVYLEYDAETDFYIIKAGIIESELSFAEGTSVSDGPTFVEDGKVIKLAVADSATVAANEEIYYEHAFLDITTGQIVYELQENRPAFSSVEATATPTLSGKFYAWDSDAKNYIQVSAKQVGIPDVDFYGLREVIVDSYDAERSILYFEDVTGLGDYDLFLQDAYKIADDFVFYAVDDEFNRYELTFAEVADIYENIQCYNAQEGTSVKHKIVFVGHSEDGEMVYDYAITTYAGSETDNGIVEYFVDDNVIDSLYGI